MAMEARMADPSVLSDPGAYSALMREYKKLTLIVPEQFSFEAEKAVLKSVGPSSALSVSVMSFSRIYDEVASVVGGMSGKLLEEADKVTKKILNDLKFKMGLELRS